MTPGLVGRWLGQFIDGLIGLAIVAVFFSMAMQSRGSGSATLVLLGYAAYIIYVLISDGFPNGQSLGKKVTKTKVIDMTSGQDCTVGQSILRNITLFIPFLGFLDILVMLLDDSHRRLGDKMAGTVVIDAYTTANEDFINSLSGETQPADKFGGL